MKLSINKLKELKSLINADQVFKNKFGNYVARFSYLYRGKDTPETKANTILNKIPKCSIINAIDVQKPFKANGEIKDNSHFYIEFKINS